MKLMHSKRWPFLWVVAAMILAAARPAQGQDRTSVIRSLVVHQGERVGEVTCYFCSVRILGEVYGDVTAIGGNVEVDGPVSGDVVAVGGDVRLGPAARVAGDAVAIGGAADKDPQATTHENDPPVSVPWFFLPGQRSFAWRGILALAGFYTLPAALFALLLRGRRLERLGESLRKWYAAVPVGILLAATFSWAFNFADRFGRWADWVDYSLAAILLILLGAGFAGLAYTVGGLFLPRTTAASVAIGTVLLVALQLIPIAGFLIFLLVLVLALGTAAWSGVGFRGGRAGPLSPYPPPRPHPTGRGPIDLFPR